MSTEFDRQALINIFVTEAADGLAKLSAVLNPNDGCSVTVDAVHAQYIVAHTLKGASSLYGFTGVAALAEVLETRHLKPPSKELQSSGFSGSRCCEA